MKIDCDCRRCGRPFTLTLDARAMKSVRSVFWQIIGVKNWAEFAVWKNQAALCRRCIEKLVWVELVKPPRLSQAELNAHIATNKAKAIAISKQLDREMSNVRIMEFDHPGATFCSGGLPSLGKKK